MKHHYININKVKIHYVQEGKGKLMVFLHGFPENWRAWEHQIDFFSKKGFKVIVPDLRGYNKSGKPKGIENYKMKTLVSDVVKLIKKNGKSCILVGHDWGGLIAWRVAMHHPELIDKLVILNAPHPAVKWYFHPVQWVRSSYILLFQIPKLPEFLLKHVGKDIFTHVFTKEPIHKKISQEKALSYIHDDDYESRLNFYRALLKYPPSLPKPFLKPTLVIWGAHDPYLGLEIARPPLEYVPNLKMEFLDASHWVQNDLPDKVNKLIFNFAGPQRGK